MTPFTDEENAAWQGRSGKTYPYNVYPASQEFKTTDGNYIFAILDNKKWKAVYIGEGDLKTRTRDPEHLACANKKRFTHYHVHVNSSEKLRKYEEEDLIKGNTECLDENGGCNKTSDE